MLATAQHRPAPIRDLYIDRRMIKESKIYGVAEAE